MNHINMKKIKIINYPWHLSHQFEFQKIPNIEWSWLIQHRRQYSAFPRGDFFKGNWVPHYEKGKYDVALLHLDQQCFEESLWERGKGSLYRQVNEVIKDIPKIVIMHGTPFYPEAFDCNITEKNYKELGFTKEQIGMNSELIEKFHKAVESISIIIFNSYKAREQWGMKDDKRAKVIWHGFDKEEWFDLPKEPRVVTMISPGGLDKYYDRTFLRGVKEVLDEKSIQLCHITVDAQFKDWSEYRNFLGRSLVYFNPTKESPMPRSRGEAMMSGCCIVTTPHQDADKFIESGKNGIIVPRNPQKVADIIESLIYDYKTAINLGQEAKKTAYDIFSGERYRKEWSDILLELTK